MSPLELDNQEFNNWCREQNLSSKAQTVIEEIRSTNPSRLVTGGRKNVCGSYPSAKMGVTIQFESHRCELARIYELEHDPEVLEYYDQPPAIELIYPSKSGRRLRHKYTPDFFIIRRQNAGWCECKTELELNKLSEANPNRYYKDCEDKWHCPPASEYARFYDLSFQVWSDAQINWNFQQNIVWLEDYLNYSDETVESTTQKTIINTVTDYPGITLAELLETESIKADDLYWLIATDKLYVELTSVKLSQPHTVKVFINQDVARAHEYMSQIEPVSLWSEKTALQIAVGKSISWDGAEWEIVNTGTTTTGLLRGDGQLIELPNAILTKLIDTGKITGIGIIETENTKSVSV